MRINWDEIFDGQEHLLVEGVHYTKTSSFTKYIYQKARERNIKVRQKVSNDNKSILVQLKKNEISVVNNPIIEGELVENIKSSSALTFEDNTYPFERWLAELTIGGQKEVDANKLDAYGNPIPIMREFEGGFKAPTGEYETEKKIVRFNPKYVIELRYPQDFSCTPRKMAAIFCEAARSYNIDVSTLHFDYSKKDKLIIRAGWMAESYFAREETPEQFNLWSTFNPKEAIPLPRAKAQEWMDKLYKEGQILLWKGKDYIGSGNNLAGLLRRNFPDIEFFAKEERDPKLGWETLLLTTRLPMLHRMDVNTTLEKWEKMPEGKKIEQERDKLREEYKESVQLTNEGLRLQLEKYNQDLNRLDKEKDKEAVLMLQEMIKEVQEEINDGK